MSIIIGIICIICFLPALVLLAHGVEWFEESLRWQR